MRNIDRSKIIFEDPRWQYLETPASFGHLTCYLGPGHQPICVITQLDDNPGRSVTNSVEAIAETLNRVTLPHIKELNDFQRQQCMLVEEYHVYWPKEEWTLDRVWFPTAKGQSPSWKPTTYEELGLALKDR